MSHRVALWRWAAALLFAGITAIVVLLRASVLHEEFRRVEIVIPAGTAEALEAGDTTSAPPHTINLVLGVRDVLVIHNQDTVWHRVGPYRVAPGHTLIQRFTRPGEIREACTMTPTEQIAITIRSRWGE